MNLKVKNKIEICYNSKNWLCIAFMILQYGKIVLDYIKELRKKEEPTL